MRETVYSTASTEMLTFDGLQKTMLEFRLKHGPPLRAIKISSVTQREIERMFPTYKAATAKTDALYGVPIEIDNNLALWECEAVHA